MIGITAGVFSRITGFHPPWSKQTVSHPTERVPAFSTLAGTEKTTKKHRRPEIRRMRFRQFYHKPLDHRRHTIGVFPWGGKKILPSAK